MDVMRKLTVVLTQHRTALDRLSGVLEENKKAFEVAVSLPLKFDVFADLTRKHAAAMSKMTAVLADLEPHLERQAKRLEADGLMPVKDPLVAGKKPKPDRHDRASLNFAVRYGHKDDEDYLRRKFDWS
jgi:hypothetical protein